MVIRRTSRGLGGKDHWSVLNNCQGKHTHTHTHTHIPTFIKEISDSPTTQSTFKLHLGAILSKDYNLCRLKMTVKMLIFLNPQIVL